MLKKIFMIFSILPLLIPYIVQADNDLPHHPQFKNLINDFEQHAGQHILLPTWLPPQYEEADVSLLFNDRLEVKYAMKQKEDGTIRLNIQTRAVIYEKHLSKMTLANGKVAYFKVERLADPFDYVPSDSDSVRLYFYDGKLLYSLSIGSRAVSTSNMKKIIIKIANSMAKC